jgi:hypothetical protein
MHAQPFESGMRLADPLCALLDYALWGKCPHSPNASAQLATALSPSFQGHESTHPALCSTTSTHIWLICADEL